MTDLTLIDGKFYQLDAHDTLTFDPAINPAIDLTGQPLEVGTKVAWGTSYRGGGGAVVGEITAIGWKPTGYSAHERTAEGEYVKEPYEYDSYDYSVRPAIPIKKTSYRYVTISRQRYQFSVATKSLQQGRKGNSFSSTHDVVAIANQAFAAA